MESKDWAFACAVDRDFLDTYHDQFVEYVSTSLRRQMADHILDLIQQDDAICIQRSEMTMRNDDARRLVSFEETLRVRPLVLCKDCKWWNESSWGCTHPGHGFAMSTPDYYCADGKRRGGADDV